MQTGTKESRTNRSKSIMKANSGIMSTIGSFCTKQSRGNRKGKPGPAEENQLLPFWSHTAVFFVLF